MEVCVWRGGRVTCCDRGMRSHVSGREVIRMWEWEREVVMKVGVGKNMCVRERERGQSVEVGKEGE